MTTALREALLDAANDRDDLTEELCAACEPHTRAARDTVLFAAYLPDATHEDLERAVGAPEFRRAALEGLVAAALGADWHAREHAPRIRGAAPGPVGEPIRRAELAARRALRSGT